MKYLLTSLILFSIYSIGFGHGGHVANFKVEVTDTSTLITFDIEMTTLNHIEFDKTTDNFDSKVAFYISNYLQKNFELKLNNNSITFELVSSTQQSGRLIVVMESIYKTDEFIDLALENNCFYKFDSSFTSKVVISSSQSEKSYRMNNINRNLYIKLK